MATDFPDIPGHRIIRRIGTGGMAAVYLAEQLGADRNVALKVLQAEHGAEPESVLRFENEARTIGRLDHPHIVRIFDVGRTADGQAYFSMPWLPRGDLTKQRDRHQPAIIISIMRALLQALAYAHKRGVVHRDVKPENVMFDADNCPLLADFGIALSDRAELRLTRPGAAVGSSGYMSPEQARGLATDGRSDLYSVGVMLYELLTGEMPYQGPDALSVSIAHVEDPIPTLPAVQRIWQPLIDRAMAKVPDERFSNADDMLQALEEIAATVLSGGSGRGSWRQAWQIWNTRNRGVMVGIAAVLLAVLVLALLVHQKPRPLPAPNIANTQAAAAPATAQPPQAILTTLQLDQLIREGNIRLSLGALTAPQGNNAGDRFTRILQAYPDNPEALGGLATLYQKLGGKIGDALSQYDGVRALELYRQAQQLADHAGIRQQPFWQPFVNDVKSRTQRNLAAASRKSQAQLDALKPMADALQLEMPTLARSSKPKPTDTVAAPQLAVGDQTGTGLTVVRMESGQRIAISTSPVSRKEYMRFVNLSGRKTSTCRTPGKFFSRIQNLNWENPGFKQTDAQPVYCVSWRDARAYLGWLSQTSGHRHRLPTSAEWQTAKSTKSADLTFDSKTREWLYCQGPCKQASIIAGNGRLKHEDSHLGYTHVGFRAVRELGKKM